MVKYTGKVLRYTKTIIFFGQVPKGSSKILFKLDFIVIFHGAPYCCVRYSNVKY